MLSVLGGLVAFIIAAASAIGALAGGGIVRGDNPWDDPTPDEATHVEGSTVWSGTNGTLISLTSEDFADGPLAASINRGNQLELHVTDADRVGTADRGYPNYIDVMRDDETNVILPTGYLTELWVVAAGDWAINLVPLDAQPITDELSGQGDAYLIYEGTATSARFIHRGEGIFFVSLYTSEGLDRPIIENGNVDQRAVWPVNNTVVIFIESDADRGAWTVDIDLLAEDDPPDPTPTDDSTPSPTPTP
ncbi:MAG: hypothetical protein ACOH19_14770 [Rhodoglobus sp.]